MRHNLLLASLAVQAKYHHYIGSSTIGANQVNEDTNLKIETDKFLVGGIFDGHGGPLVSNFVNSTFASILEKESEIDDASGFFKLKYSDIQQRIKLNSKYFYQGSCALIIYVSKEDIVVANTGDSIAYFFDLDGKPVPQQLNSLHNIREKSEQIKLQERFPSENDLYMCYPGGHACYVKGKLQLTRSLGDLYLGEYLVRDPEIDSYPSKPGFIVIGSDGFWDELTPEQVKDYLKKNENAEDIAKRLLDAAYKHAAKKSHMTPLQLHSLPAKERRSRVDDLTVLVISTFKFFNTKKSEL
jgi:protein phosphatase 1L